jgi:hypothetical protein
MTSLSFGFCLSLAHELYPGWKIILTNADIYFNETLNLLKDYDLTNKLLAITRWQVKPDGTVTPYVGKDKTPTMCSQDTWIFSTPIHISEHYNIAIGSVHGDNLLAYYARHPDCSV